MKNQQKRKIRQLLRLAKKVVKKETYKKLKSVEDEPEQLSAIQYAMIAALEKEHYTLDKEIKNLEKDLKDVFTAKNKSILVPSKIKHFEVAFNKDEFYKVYRLLNDIKKEIQKI
jgi:hypothetical protein